MISKEEMLKEPAKYVPSGLYCYKRIDKTNKVMCPFWSIKEDLPEQENGFCDLLNISDYDRNEEADKNGGLKIIYDGMFDE